MLDHPSRPDQTATVAERRAQVAASAAALRLRLAPDRLIVGGAAQLQRAAQEAVRGAGTLMQRNPGAVALTIAGLAWLALGPRERPPAGPPHFEAVSRWEDEGGTPHPDYDSVVDEVGEPGPVRRNRLAWFAQVARAVRDHPVPFGLAAAALGGVLAARLPVTGIEQAVVADARDHLRAQACRFLDEGQARAETAAREAAGDLPDDLDRV